MYREPAVRLRQKLNPEYVLGSSPNLIPVIMGSGATQFKKTQAMKRGSDLYDVLPSDAVVSMLTVGNSSGVADYSSSNDFTKVTPNILHWGKLATSGTVVSATDTTVVLATTDSAVDDFYNDKKIVIVNGVGAGQTRVITNYVGSTKAATVVAWTVNPDATSEYEIWTNSVKEPEMGDVYYVTYVAGPESDQYEPKFVSSPEEVEELYGPELKYENGLINPVVVGAKCALANRASIICILQVALAGSTVAVTDYEKAFTEYLAHMTYAYRIIPMDLSTTIGEAAVAYVRQMSDPEEKMECKTMIGVVHSSTTHAELMTNIGAYAAAFGEKRLMIPYPDKATKKLSDGNIYELPAPYLLAAYAGKQSSQPIEQSMTNSTLDGFITLKGVKMSRAQKNLLAEKGVMLLEQASPGFPITVRDALTTDMSSIQTRQDMVVSIVDFASKYIRDVLAPYIGPTNTTTETITRMRGSVNTAIAVLVSMQVLTGGRITDIYRDSLSPDTIIVKISVDVPYPCNYIDVDLFVN